MSRTPSILAIDQGTTGSTALVVSDEGRVTAKAYRDELTRLHLYVKVVIASIPEPARILGAGHERAGRIDRGPADRDGRSQ